MQKTDFIPYIVNTMQFLTKLNDLEEMMISLFESEESCIMTFHNSFLIDHLKLIQHTFDFTDTDIEIIEEFILNKAIYGEGDLEGINTPGELWDYLKNN